MEPDHPSLIVLAELMAGDLDADEIRRCIVPHLAACCSACRKSLEELERLQRDFDHWSEPIVVREGLEAPEQFDELFGLPHEDRLMTIDQDESYHTWGLAQLLLQRCREAVFDDPPRAVEMAEIAVRITEQLPPNAYHVDWVGELTARAWAHLANTRRVMGDLATAATDLRRARWILHKHGTGRPWVEAEIEDLTASLLRDQGHYSEALERLDRAQQLYQVEGDSHRLGRNKVSRAKVLEAMGRFDEAIELLEQVPSLLDPEREPRLPFYARKNLLCGLLLAGRYLEARALLPELWDAVDPTAPEVDRMRLRWIEARIAHGLDEHSDAERSYREVQAFFLAKQQDLEVAVASLDLGLLYAEQGRAAELEELSAELLPLFESQRLGREVLMVLYLFRDSVERRMVSVGLVRDMVAALAPRCPARV